MSSQELLAENRAMGWERVVGAPQWAQERIVEIRSALMAKKPVPAPTREYVAAAEQRCLSAARFVNRLFPTRKNNDDLRARAARLGEEIRQTTVVNWLTREERQQLYFAAGLETSEEIQDRKEAHSKIFPWES